MESYVENKKMTNVNEGWSFGKYHESNPHIYAMFKVMALKAIKAGSRVGAQTILEHMRYNTAVEGNDGFKINHNARSHYSRMFHEDFPEYDGYFSTRGDA